MKGEPMETKTEERKPVAGWTFKNTEGDLCLRLDSRLLVSAGYISESIYYWRFGTYSHILTRGREKTLIAAQLAAEEAALGIVDDMLRALGKTVLLTAIQDANGQLIEDHKPKPEAALVNAVMLQALRLARTALDIWKRESAFSLFADATTTTPSVDMLMTEIGKAIAAGEDGIDRLRASHARLLACLKHRTQWDDPQEDAEPGSAIREAEKLTEGKDNDDGNLQ